MSAKPEPEHHADHPLDKHEDKRFVFDEDPFMENPVLRLAGLSARVGALFASGFSKGVRYLAFTSDVGEAFRPVAHPGLVRAGYGVSIAYVLGDIAYTVKRAKDADRDYVRAGSEAAVFQFFGSLLLPAVIVHTVVHQSEKVVKRFAKPGSFPMRWGAVGMGLAIIPFLPVMVDQPVELAVEEAFHRFWPEQHADHHSEHKKE